MLRDDWDDELKAFRWIGSALLAVIAFTILLSKFSLVDPECQDATQQYYIARERALLHQHQVPTEQIDSADNAREHADVCAQNRMAYAAELGLLLVFLTVLFTGGAFWASRRTVKLMDETSRHELRPYINIKSAQLVLGEKVGIGRNATFDIVFENFGATPARDVRTVVKINWGYGGDMVRKIFYGGIGPGGTFTFKETVTIWQQDLDRMSKNRAAVVVSGRTTYATPFSAPKPVTVFDLVNDHPFFEDIADPRTLMGYHLIARMGGGNQCT